jgi:hypothetical protein
LVSNLEGILAGFSHLDINVVNGNNMQPEETHFIHMEPFFKNILAKSYLFKLVIPYSIYLKFLGKSYSVDN